MKHVSVIGSGIMGSRIACHFANAGFRVLLLDIAPKELNDKEKAKGLTLEDKAVKNRIVNDAFQNTLKTNPSPIYSKSFIKRVTLGNMDDDFSKIKESDWIIEVVVERLDIKKIVFDKIEKFRKKGSIVTSNTSGIPIALMSEGRSEEFLENFAISHFFNPPRYMPLLEVIPNAKTKPEVTDFILHFGKKFLGKATVKAKDTPAFIGNRLGIYNIMLVMKTAEKLGLNFHEVDQLTGTLIGKAKSATYGTSDVVGLDTMVHVANGLATNLKDDESLDTFKIPAIVEYMMENNLLGRKTKAGFFKMDKSGGKKTLYQLDPQTKEYVLAEGRKFDTIKTLKSMSLSKRYAAMIKGDDVAAEFYRELNAGLFAYVSNRVPEISDSIQDVDTAMKAGFGWKHGPFEIWEKIGVKKGITLAEKYGYKVADWVKNVDSFFKLEDGVEKFYSPISNGMTSVEPITKLQLKYLKHTNTIWSNDEASIIDLGDGIINLEFHSKMNSLGSGVLAGLIKAIDIAETENKKGLTIFNEGSNFSVGANIGMIFMLAAEQDYDELNMAVAQFQNAMMRVRYSDIPVVVCPHNMTLGGGCEVTLHADAVVAHAETYMGLVEFGVGVIPGGGGTKETVRQLHLNHVKNDVDINRFSEAFMKIGTAKVSTSAYEAMDMGYLIRGRDHIVMSRELQLQVAKQKALSLHEAGYTRPIAEPIQVLGKNVQGAFAVAIDSMIRGGYITEYDAVVANELAHVMSGGNFSEPTFVSEEYLLKKEREAFVKLCTQKKTLERIQHMLTKGKPLRN